ncbi:protein POLYCHOME-like [Amaranthus tricolor]|uniref:protein POLYCHOME-like n=1 Tax=Amaranthus tricolor TaxID=29722 RepID=UPI00258848F1|nr:protein POLYCHOME-like [Amaranthus tricolor]XP_057519871.1 protein POLYCHOME-like [Amaranthus tricolor]
MSNLSRDRLARPVDISTLYNGAARRVDLIVEIPGLRWAGLSGTGPRNRSDSNRLSVGVQGGRWRGRGWQYQRPLVVDQENRTPTTMVRRNGGDRGRRSLLPAWYPRTPLRDITAIVRAIETRRAERDQITQEAAQQNTNAEAEAASDSELDQQIGSQTPLPTISRNPKPSTASQSWKTPKIADKNEYNPDFMTPQKILLNSIEKVREAWLVDQKKLARTPAAKRAEREQKVRVLMSMR